MGRWNRQAQVGGRPVSELPFLPFHWPSLPVYLFVCSLARLYQWLPACHSALSFCHEPREFFLICIASYEHLPAPAQDEARMRDGLLFFFSVVLLLRIFSAQDIIIIIIKIPIFLSSLKRVRPSAREASSRAKSFQSRA